MFYPIPKQLWQAAAELAKKHSIATVSKALGLRYLSMAREAKTDTQFYLYAFLNNLGYTG
ncbi:MAG: hypothetical protein ACYCXK_07670 [Candidatus Humimicrobiaceae bacterium]